MQKLLGLGKECEFVAKLTPCPYLWQWMCDMSGCHRS